MIQYAPFYSQIQHVRLRTKVQNDSIIQDSPVLILSRYWDQSYLLAISLYFIVIAGRETTEISGHLTLTEGYL